MTKKRRSKRTTVRRAPELQRFHDLAQAVGAYLKSIGWTAIVVGSPAILGEPLPGREQFLVPRHLHRRQNPDEGEA